MMSAQCLSAILQGTSDDVYVLDKTSLRIVQASDTSCANMRFAAEELQQATLCELCDPVIAPELERQLRSLSKKNPASSIDTVLIRKDGSRCQINLRLFVRPVSRPSVIVAIGKARLTADDGDVLLSQSRFEAIVANTPGLVYQFLLQPDGSISFPYLSEGCQALLGVTPESLRAKPSQLFDLILPEDRESYAASMSASASTLKSWNWVGRIWIDAWKDIKWINLRATPQSAKNGGVRWDGIMTNITQSKLEEMEIKQSRARLAELSAHVEQVKEQERTQISREIHDDLGGNLTAIKMALAILSRRLPEDNADLADKVAYVDLLVDRTIEAAHRIAIDLRPSILDCGIVAALEWQAGEFTTQLGIPCNFESNAVEIDLHPDQATAIFRISQEALTNIAKHANASWVGIQLTRTKNNLHLMICDNGKGMDAADRLKPQSFGIRGMIERAKSLGGKLTIGPSQQGGNMVTVKIPLSWSPKSAGKENYRPLTTSSIE